MRRVVRDVLVARLVANAASSRRRRRRSDAAARAMLAALCLRRLVLLPARAGAGLLWLWFRCWWWCCVAAHCTPVFGLRHGGGLIVLLPAAGRARERAVLCDKGKTERDEARPSARKRGGGVAAFGRSSGPVHDAEQQFLGLLQVSVAHWYCSPFSADERPQTCPTDQRATNCPCCCCVAVVGGCLLVSCKRTYL